MRWEPIYSYTLLYLILPFTVSVTALSLDATRNSSSDSHHRFLNFSGSPMATNVVVVLGVVIRFSSVVSRPIVMKLFTHINDNIVHQATVADFSFRP